MSHDVVICEWCQKNRAIGTTIIKKATPKRPGGQRIHVCRPCMRDIARQRDGLTRKQIDEMERVTAQF